MSDSIETVKVLPWSDSQGDFVVINKADYDPEKHTLYSENKKPARRQK